MSFQVLEYMITGKEGQNPGPFLKKLRDEKGLTQAEVAKTLKMDAGHLSKIENGKKVPVFQTIIDYLKAIKYSVMIVSSDDFQPGK